jgi:hypothetical protein
VSILHCTGGANCVISGGKFMGNTGITIVMLLQAFSTISNTIFDTNYPNSVFGVSGIYAVFSTLTTNRITMQNSDADSGCFFNIRDSSIFTDNYSVLKDTN